MEGIHKHLEGNPIFPEEKVDCTQEKRTFPEEKFNFTEGNLVFLKEKFNCAQGKRTFPEEKVDCTQGNLVDTERKESVQ